MIIINEKLYTHIERTKLATTLFVTIIAIDRRAAISERMFDGEYPKVCVNLQTDVR